MTEDIVPVIQDLITSSISMFIPDVVVNKIDVIQNKDNNSIYITVQYSLAISGTSNQITVEFI
jgi:hypothetical protein